MKKTLFAAALAVVALAATSCGGEQGFITEGKSSKLDSLSYAMGANVGFSINNQLGDIPFDLNSITEGFQTAAFEKNELSGEEAIEILRDYFMNKRQERARLVYEARQEADSIAIVNGATPEEVAEARAAMKADESMFESEEERTEVSYAFGIDLGTNIRTAEIPIQTYWFSKAFKDVFEGSSVLDAEAAHAYLANFFEVVRPAQYAAEIAEKMAKIEKQKGVQKTESGILYRIEKAGEELKATDDRDAVKVFYTGKTVRKDELFDTNRFADRPADQQEAALAQNPDAATADEPIEFSLNRVIPGWSEGMKLVGKGGRISLWIPAELAYGQRGAGRVVGPNEALFFDVELVDVTPYVEEVEETETEEESAE